MLIIIQIHEVEGGLGCVCVWGDVGVFVSAGAWTCMEVKGVGVGVGGGGWLVLVV